MKSNDANCGYCGKESETLTRDHIVPQAFWKDAQSPPFAKTIAACTKCQTFWDRETTYFRNLVVLMSNPEDHPAIQRLASGSVRRSIRRSRRDRAGLTRSATFGWRRTDLGLVTERGVRIQLNLQRFNRTPEKIIRGLFHMRSGKVVPTDYEVRLYPGSGFWRDAGFQGLLSQMESLKGLGDDIFQMRAARDISDPGFTAWLLVFFRSVALFGYTCPRGFRGQELNAKCLEQLEDGCRTAISTFANY